MATPRVLAVRRMAIDWRALGAAAVFVAVVAVLVVEGRGEPRGSDANSQDAGAFALLAVASATLLFRRRWPLGVMLVVVAAAYAWWHGIHYDSRAINIPYLVALYTVAVTGNSRRTVLVGAVLAVSSAAALVLLGDGLDVLRWLTGLGWTVAALLFGETVRARSELAEASEERARRAEAEAEHRIAEERFRIAEERLRIARDLHDVLAHTVSVMSVQAEVAADSLDRDRAAARDALGTIRHAARDAMAEVRATVSVLRSDPGPARVAPVPRIDQVGDVVVAAREHGLEVDVHTALSGRALPEVMELTVYRVIQEAITNVVRHADASSASVAIREEGERVNVEIRDDGTARNGSVTAGFGLRGMAERVESIGGELWHGHARDGGWVVRASLPFSGVTR